MIISKKSLRFTSGFVRHYNRIVYLKCQGSVNNGYNIILNITSVFADWECYVPEQNERAAGKKCFFQSFLCVPLPNRSAHHPNSRGQDRWRGAGWQCGTPPSSAQHPEHHSAAGPLHRHHDSRWACLWMGKLEALQFVFVYSTIHLTQCLMINIQKNTKGWETHRNNWWNKHICLNLCCSFRAQIM